VKRSRLLLVNATTGNGVDGIDEYSRCLTAALSARGIGAALLTRRAGIWTEWFPDTDTTTRLSTRGQVITRLTSTDDVVLQYNPFSWGNRGFAPGLVALLAVTDARPRGPRVSVMLHERHMPSGAWRETAMHVWQRAQLAAVSRLTAQGFVSTDAWAGLDRFGGRRRPTTLLPVGSNLPDERSARVAQREALRLPENAVVLACFGTNHPSRMMGHVSAAANATAAAAPVVVLNLGADAPDLHTLSPAIRLIQPDRIDSHELARLLSAADLYLAPFIDGVSTRRTTLVSALQHGLPIVGTTGTSTGARLQSEAALTLVPAAAGPAVFADTVARLAADEPERVRLAEGSRLLYEEKFSWPTIARRLIAELALCP
jgi:glycosyltransferase involved in cell wall biosynthesis